MFAVIPLACIAHIIWGLFFGGRQQWPVVEMVLITAAVISLLRMLVVKPFRYGLLTLNIFAWLLAGGFLWWTQVYSSYPKMNAKISVGENIAGRFSSFETTAVSGLRAAPVNDGDRPSEMAPAPIKIELALPEEEEIFLDASGKSFHLTPAPVTAQEKITSTVPARSGGAIALRQAPFLDQSAATLVVFFRGWW